MNVSLQHYMINFLILITISELDQIQNANENLCNFWLFIIKTWTPNYRLQKHEGIIWFSISQAFDIIGMTHVLGQWPNAWKNLCSQKNT
jgi:hypothetical protein